MLAFIRSKYLIFLIPILICILVVSSFVCILVIHFSRHSNTRCSPSSCGSIRNISSPFRLNTDPEDCGNPDYELTCEQNRTVLTLHYSQKYYVQSINYDNYTVRVVDSGVQQNNICSFPRYALAQYSFDERYPYGIATPDKMTPYGWQDSTLITVPIIFLRCPFPMKSSAFVETSKQCWNKSTESSWGYAYAKLGSLNASDLRISCRVELITMTSWRIQEKVSSQKVSLVEIHDALMYGFELSWVRVVCQQHCGSHRRCYLDLKNEISCDYYFQSYGTLQNIWFYLAGLAEIAIEPIMEVDQEQSSMPESSESIALLPNSANSNSIVLTLKSQKYYVQSINYNNFTIRVVDPGVQENNLCSFPRYALAGYNFSGYLNPYAISRTLFRWEDVRPLITVPIIFFSCPFPVKSSTSSAFVETTKDCSNKTSGGYAYAKLGPLNASDLRISCQVELITMTSWRIQENMSEINATSLLEIHDALMYGFELFWIPILCQQHCGWSRLCYLGLNNEIYCEIKYEPIMEVDQEQSSMPESSESIAFLPSSANSNNIDIIVD
nr:rust resistance kinase Lr10-like isoform X1 [Ipomoea batatas]